MANHTILGGKVHISKRPNSRFWQCCTWLAGRNRSPVAGFYAAVDTFIIFPDKHSERAEWFISHSRAHDSALALAHPTATDAAGRSRYALLDGPRPISG